MRWIAAALSCPLIAAAQTYGSVLTYDDQARLDALRRSQSEADAKHRAEMKAFREKVLRLPPLPADRNVLLGRWRVEASGRAQRKDDLGQLMGLLANPGGAMCEMLFGAGITEFKPGSWSSIDRSGDDSLGPIQYRAAGKDIVAAFPAKGVEQMYFSVKGPNRIEMFEGCVLARVGAPAAPDSARANAAAPGERVSTADLQVAANAPPVRSTLARPSREVCAMTFVDQLGAVGVNQVRAMSDVRFREPAIEGRVPNSNNLRIDLRGSACDDPRIKATLYDFDATGMLQSITYVWDRPAGPAPAPIFSERARLLSSAYTPAPPTSPQRWQGSTARVRVVLEDRPDRNLLLEAYGMPR